MIEESGREQIQVVAQIANNYGLIKARDALIETANSYYVGDKLSGELFFVFNGPNENYALLREQPFGGESLLCELIVEQFKYKLRDYYQ